MEQLHPALQADLAAAIRQDPLCPLRNRARKHAVLSVVDGRGHGVGAEAAAGLRFGDDASEGVVGVGGREPFRIGHRRATASRVTRKIIYVNKIDPFIDGFQVIRLSFLNICIRKITPMPTPINFPTVDATNFAVHPSVPPVEISK